MTIPRPDYGHHLDLTRIDVLHKQMEVDFDTNLDPEWLDANLDTFVTRASNLSLLVGPPGISITIDDEGSQVRVGLLVWHSTGHFFVRGLTLDKSYLTYGRGADGAVELLNKIGKTADNVLAMVYTVFPGALDKHVAAMAPRVRELRAQQDEIAGVTA